MRMPSHAALCSFTFSLLLTSALVPSSGNVELASAGAPAAQLAVQTALKGLRAEGFAGGTKLALPAPASSPASASAASATVPGSGLTPPLVSKMLRFLSLNGKDSVMLQSFANALGLTGAGENWPDRIVSASSGTDIHGFATNRGSGQDIVIFNHLPDVIHVFRAQRNGLVVSAIDMNPTTKQITQVSPSEAQAGCDAEIAYWASAVDGLIAGR